MDSTSSDRNLQTHNGEAAIFAATAIGIKAMELMSQARTVEQRRAIQRIAMEGVKKIRADREAGP